MKKLGESKENIKKDIIVENLMISNGVPNDIKWSISTCSSSQSW